MKNNRLNFGIGKTELLSLRVSIGALVKVLFNSPENNKLMLILERTATLRENNDRKEIIIKAKPFGGGIRIKNPEALQSRIGEFHYDSEKSRQEKDFRIFVHPESWGEIKTICTDPNELKNGFLDNSPDRELAEEFEDSLNIKINRSQYDLKTNGIIIEDLPLETDNINAQGFHTVRIYYLFKARINSPEIINIILRSSEQYTDNDLAQIAWKDAAQGGKGRANSILAIDLDELNVFYHSVSVGITNELIRFKEHYFAGNVIAILDEITHPKYKRIY